MSMVAMGLSNYRCFTKWQDIELRPVTVVLGRNNSGKSALVRSPLVLSTGIHTDSSSPLDLDLLSEEVVDSFTSLLYGGRPHGSLSLRLRVGDSAKPPVELEATIQNIDEYRMQVVSRLEVRSEGQTTTFEWEPSDPPVEPHRYTVTGRQTSISNVAVRLEGLLPVEILDDRVLGSLQLDVQTAVERMRSGFGSVRYLGPFRDRPIRLYRLPARMPSDVGTSGENTAGILASDVTRQGGRLVRQINEDLEENLPGWSIDVVERGGMHAVILKSHEDETLSINLADTGTGIAQALPIFVQRALDVLNPPSRPVLEIIEQPELHLHPAAHALLADLYLKAAARTNVRFLIETHSETFLLRLRRRIAEGSIDPSVVAVYFVDHRGGYATARKINIDPDGNLDYWPEGVFSEDYAETQKIVKAQLGKAGADAR